MQRLSERTLPEAYEFVNWAGKLAETCVLRSDACSFCQLI